MPLFLGTGFFLELFDGPVDGDLDRDLFSPDSDVLFRNTSTVDAVVFLEGGGGLSGLVDLEWPQSSSGDRAFRRRRSTVTWKFHGIETSDGAPGRLNILPEPSSVSII